MVNDATSGWSPWGQWRWLLVALIGGPMLWLSMALSIAGVFDRHRPEIALAWWPWSADGAANLASKMVVDPSPVLRRKASVLARKALARQATLPVAARTLAIAETYKDPTSTKPKQLIQYSEALSRRDAPTQLWLIEDNVQRSDVAGALIHYDRILRTSLESRIQVLPVLTAAVNDPAIARQLAHLLKRNPPWRDDFLSRMVTQVDNPVSLAILLPASGLSTGQLSDRNLLQLGLARIAVLGAPDVAYRLYRQVGGLRPAPNQAVVNGNLAREPSLTPFDWSTSDDPALTTTRESTASGWRLHASLAAGAKGNLARQLLLLSPGRYKLDAHASGPQDGSTLTLTLRCLDGSLLYSAPLKASDPIVGNVDVMGACKAAWLTFEGRGALDNGPSDYWIGPISVRRAP